VRLQIKIKTIEELTCFGPSYLENGRDTMIFTEEFKEKSSTKLDFIKKKIIILGIGSFLAPFDHFYLGNHKN
jgi:hypothetical protein